MPSEILSIRTVHEGFTKFQVAQVRLADGAVVTREVEDHGQAVCVLAYDPERRVALLVRQFRLPVFCSSKQQDLLEVIAGLAEGPHPDGDVRREAMEEAGLVLRNLQSVASLYSCPGISTERVGLYLAEYRAADRVGPGGGLPHEHETIAVQEVPLQVLAAQADAGAFQDMKTFALVQTLRLRMPELFASATQAAKAS